VKSSLARDARLFVLAKKLEENAAFARWFGEEKNVEK
jgi:hypothetical protein